jgi:hypothetical protein
MNSDPPSHVAKKSKSWLWATIAVVGVVVIVLAIVLPIFLLGGNHSSSFSSNKSLSSSSTSSSASSSSSSASSSASSIPINPLMPVSGSTLLINAENGTTNLHRVSGVDGLLHTDVTNNSDTNQQWKFTLIGQVNTTTYTYIIEMVSSPTVCTIDSSNSDLCVAFNGMSTQVWDVQLQSGTGQFGTNIFTIFQSVTYLTYTPGLSFNILSLALKPTVSTPQYFSFNLLIT